MNKQELLDAIKDDWATLEALIASLDETRLTARELDAGWSVKDVLAHIATWEALCASWLESVAQGITPERSEVKDVDGTNARAYAEAKDASLATVRVRSHDAHGALVRSVEALSYGDLADETRFGWPLWKMASSNSDDHYREHIEQIRAWLEHRPAMTDQPKAIFFDMDGTILDWTTGMEDSWLASCETYGDGTIAPADMHAAIRTRRTWFWDDPERQYRGRMDLDAASREIVRYAFADLGLSDDKRDIAHRIADHYRALRAVAIAPYAGALETLDAIRARGIPMALITNGEANNQRRAVEKHALERYFDCIVIEGEFGVGKPDERVFRHALAAVGAAPEQTWMVGDSLEADIATPRRLGMHTVWVDETGSGLPETAPVRPHRIVRSIAELAPSS